MAEFDSFFMGGFECATHRRRDGLRIDVTATTGHDMSAKEDYLLLQKAGVRTVRDGLRWHLIEAVPGIYDWSSFSASAGGCIGHAYAGLVGPLPLGGCRMDSISSPRSL